MMMVMKYMRSRVPEWIHGIPNSPDPIRIDYMCTMRANFKPTYELTGRF